jgi:hypothetical protein
MAVISNGRAMDHADACCTCPALGGKGRVEHYISHGASSYVVKLRSGQVKLVCVRHEYLSSMIIFCLFVLFCLVFRFW